MTEMSWSRHATVIRRVLFSEVAGFPARRSSLKTMPPRHPTILLLLCSVIANAQEHELTPEGVHFFEAKIRHVLVEQCFQCHSAEEKIRGGLVLDSREGMRRGGDSGEAIIPGDPEASLLWRAIGGQDPSSLRSQGRNPTRPPHHQH